MELEIIKIGSPFAPLSLVLHPQEFEARSPSFRCQVICTIPHPTGRFSYEATDVWFSATDFDSFISELEGIARGTLELAQLNDMSDFLSFRVALIEQKTSVTLNVFEPSPNGAEARLSLKADVDADFPAKVLASLREREK